LVREDSSKRGPTNQRAHNRRRGKYRGPAGSPLSRSFNTKEGVRPKKEAENGGRRLSSREERGGKGGTNNQSCLGQPVIISDRVPFIRGKVSVFRRKGPKSAGIWPNGTMRQTKPNKRSEKGGIKILQFGIEEV